MSDDKTKAPGKKPVAQVAPNPVSMQPDDPAQGSALAAVKPFWSAVHAAPAQQVGPPTADATLDSPYYHEPLPALTVEEQYKYMLNQQAFSNAPPGAPKVDPKGVGAGVGPAKAPGYQVHAAIQVVDKDGNQRYVGYGAYMGGGGPHGEEQALNNLRAHLTKGPDLQGGRLITTVTQCPCGPDRHDCSLLIEKFAKEYGLTPETYVAERDAVNPNQKRPVSASTAARGAQRTDRPPIRFKAVTPTAATPVPKSPKAAVGSATGLPFVGGANPAGVNKINNIAAVLDGVHFVLIAAGNAHQKALVEKELKSQIRSLQKHQINFPDQGSLLVFVFFQPIVGLLMPQPGPRFIQCENGYGGTEAEALQDWRRRGRVMESPGLNTRVIRQTVWLPPPGP